MSEDYLKLFTGVVLLIFVIIAGYFFSERNDRKIREYYRHEYSHVNNNRSLT